MALTQGGIVLVRELDTGSFVFDDSTKKIKVKGVSGVALAGTTLRLTLADGTTKEANLAGLIPAQKADHFLKKVEKVGSNLRFTVGAQGTTDGETTVEIPVADLVPVSSDNVTLEGNGTAANPLKIKDGAVEAKAKAAATVTLVSAFGDPIAKAFPTA